MNQPWDKETQVCANKVPVVINGPADHEPLARMIVKLAWSILGTRKFKFVQMKSLGSQMALAYPQKGAKKGNIF